MLPPSRRLAARAAAFTLIELCAVVALLAALSGFAAVLINGARDRAASFRAAGELAVLLQAIEDYRLHYGVYPEATTAEELFDSLIGRIGPQRTALDPPGRRLIATGRFRLRETDPSAAGNAVLDPWNQPYRYVAFARTTNGVTARGFVLFSSGPDGRAKPNDPPVAGSAAGEPDLSAPENADNLYANR